MFKGLTPWGPIVVVAIVALGGAWVVVRLTGRPSYAWSYVLLVAGLALAVFGTIATAMFVPAAILLVLALAIFVGTLRQSAPMR